jgi:hypothetical protein
MDVVLQGGCASVTGLFADAAGIRKQNASPQKKARVSLADDEESPLPPSPASALAGRAKQSSGAVASASNEDPGANTVKSMFCLQLLFY